MNQNPLRKRLVEIALEWEKQFGVAPHITAAVSEFDAAMLMGCSEAEYSCQAQGRTAVKSGDDFVFDGKRYQVKGNRPSGKPGSSVTKVGKANNYDWDYLIWMHYDPSFRLQEAWLWDVDSYRSKFHKMRRLGPTDMRLGQCLKKLESEGGRNA